MRFFGKRPAISPKREGRGDPEGDTYGKNFTEDNSHRSDLTSSKTAAMASRRGQKVPAPSIQSSPDRYRDTEEESQYSNEDDDINAYPLLRVPTAQAYESDDSDLELSRKDSRYDFRRDHLDDLDLEDDRMDRYGQTGTRRRLMPCDSDSSAGAMWTSFDEYDLRQDGRDPLQFDPHDTAWEIGDGEEEGGSLLDIRDGPDGGYDIMELARNNIRSSGEIRDPPDATAQTEDSKDGIKVQSTDAQMDDINGLPSYRTRNRTSYRSKNRPSYLGRAHREQIQNEQLPEDILEDLLEHPKHQHLHPTMPMNSMRDEAAEEDNFEEIGETIGEFQESNTDERKSSEVEEGYEKDLMPPVQFKANNSDESKSSLSSFLDGTFDDKKSGSVQEGKTLGRRASRRQQEELVIKVPPREPDTEVPTPKGRRNSRRPPRKPSSPTQAEVVRKVQELNKNKKQRRKSGASSPPSVNSDGKKAFGLGFFRKRTAKSQVTQEIDQQSENETNKQYITESEQTPPISVAEAPNEEVSFLDDEDDINTLHDDPIYMERQDAKQNDIAQEEELKLAASTEKRSRCRVVPVAEECGIFQAVSGLMGLEDDDNPFRNRKALKDGEITLDSVDTPQDKDQQPSTGYCSNNWCNGADEPDATPSTAVVDQEKPDLTSATATNDVNGTFEESSAVQDYLKGEMSQEHSLQQMDKDEPGAVLCLRDHYCDPVANCVMYGVQGIENLGCQPDFEYLDNAIKAEDPADDSPKSAVHPGSFALDNNRSKRHSRNQSKTRRATVVDLEEEDEELIDLPFKTIEIPAAVSAYETESVNASSYTNFGGRRNTGALRVDTSLEEEMKEIEGELAGGKKKSLFRRMRRK